MQDATLTPYSISNSGNFLQGWPQLLPAQALLPRVTNAGSQFVTRGPKKAVLKRRNLPVFVEMQSNPETGDCRYFDAKCCQEMTAQFQGTKIHSKHQLFLCWEKKLHCVSKAC